MRLGELEGIVGEEDGYTAESDAAICCRGSTFPTRLHDRKMGELQGGQKVRVLLAQALFGKPQALLLDEPTNHLDLDSIHWLQDFLMRYEGTLMTISHDRHFLNRVCTHIADIDYETIITYIGGYDDMVMAKTQIRSRVEVAERAAGEEDRAAERLHRPLLRRHAVDQVQCRKKEIERLQTTRTGALEHRSARYPLRQKRPSGKHVLEFEGVNKSYGDLKVINGFQRQRAARRQDRADGAQRRGQDHAAEVAAAGAKRRPEMRSELTSRFRHRQRHGEVGPRGADRLLPAGHRARSSTADRRRLAAPVRREGDQGRYPRHPGPDAVPGRGGAEDHRRALRRRGGAAAVLQADAAEAEHPVLDEPTNHLDLESINALNVAIQKYEGTVLLVTHDHDLIEEVATRIWHFDDGRH